MDSLTQIALGSAVSVAVMGRRTAPWKAALWGAIGGTLPDLDVVIDYGNPVLNMVRHRAETHSLFYLSLLSPLLGWLAARVHGEQRGFKHWWLAMWLVLVTHPLLDNMTVYGTQLLVPFTSYPFGVGSIFIIDPAYTLPLLVGVGAALIHKSQRGLRWNAAALSISSLYLGWTMVAQQRVTTLAQHALPVAQASHGDLLVTPTPFNSVLWRLVYTTPDQYFEAYYSWFDPAPDINWTAHPRGADLIERYADLDAVARIAAFSHGFYKMGLSPQDRVVLSDLRMGQEPTYSFRFDLGHSQPGGSDTVGAAPIRQLSMRPDLNKALPWLWQRMTGRTQASWVASHP
jgi:inner membrane protein